MLTALALLFSNSYGGMVTHYGGAAGPVIFGVGYNDIKSWWLVGAVLTILTFWCISPSACGGGIC